MIFEPQKGTQFFNAIEECKKEINEHKRAYMTLKFNDIETTVYPDSNPNDIAKIHDLQRQVIRLGGKL